MFPMFQTMLTRIGVSIYSNLGSGFQIIYKGFLFEGRVIEGLTPYFTDRNSVSGGVCTGIDQWNHGVPVPKPPSSNEEFMGWGSQSPRSFITSTDVFLILPKYMSDHINDINFWLLSLVHYKCDIQQFIQALIIMTNWENKAMEEAGLITAHLGLYKPFKTKDSYLPVYVTIQKNIPAEQNTR